VAKVWTIYSLTVEGEELPFYVGCTSRSDHRRKIEHRCDGLTKFPKSAKGAVMREASSRGKTVTSEPLETAADLLSAHAAEARWITKFGRHPNGPLVNRTDGGPGNRGWDASTETRARMSEAKMGHKINLGRSRPDTREMFSQSITAHLLNGSWVGSYSSAREAAERLQIRFGQISSVLTGKIKATKAHDGNIYQFRKGHDTSPMNEVSYRSQSSRRK
jgi:hypothetical protein